MLYSHQVTQGKEILGWSWSQRQLKHLLDEPEFRGQIGRDRAGKCNGPCAALDAGKTASVSFLKPVRSGKSHPVLVNVIPNTRPQTTKNGSK